MRFQVLNLDGENGRIGLQKGSRPASGPEYVLEVIDANRKYDQVQHARLMVDFHIPDAIIHHICEIPTPRPYG
ncbi:hypothetical protein ACTXT7_016180 [Hymenolepis weldensis]